MTMPNTKHTTAFAIWLTGLPASGKSTITRHLKSRLESEHGRIEVLESDEVRRWLTPEATYSEAERDLFYRALAFTASKLVAYGIVVIIDATAPKRQYRGFARSLIQNFLEVAVECPLEICQERDYKGTYRRGQSGQTSTVPGLQVPYEPPTNPDVIIDTTQVQASDGADLVMRAVTQRFHRFELP